MNHCIGASYESLVQDLVLNLCQATPLHAFRIGGGAKNKVQGASGYKHQIDLSLEDSTKLFIIELKCLNRSIGVSEILVLSSRLIDITRSNPAKTVIASIVSKRPPSRNVQPLAQHFGIQVDVVVDLNSYALTFSNQHFLGVHEKVVATSSAEIEVIRKNGP